VVECQIKTSFPKEVLKSRSTWTEDGGVRGDTQWFLERARARDQRYIAHLVTFLGRSPEFGNSPGSAKLRQVKEDVAPARQPSRWPQLLGG
jgi:hypothetical protein